MLPLGVMAAAAAATDVAIQTKTYESDITTPIIPNKEMNDIMKIVKALEESSLLIKDFSKAKHSKMK